MEAAISTRRRFAVDALHVTGLSGLAIAQPLLDLLARNAEFFIARNAQRVDVVLVPLALCALLPATLVLLQVCASLLGGRVRRAVHATTVALLLTAIALQVLKRLGDVSAAALLGTAGGIGLAATLGYIRLRPIQTFTTILGAAVPVLCGLFLLNPQVLKILKTTGATPSDFPTLPVTTPVVMVIFDELPITSLLNEPGEIDPVLYPSFAELARWATWYRNAMSISPWTHISVPAIVSSQYPDKRRMPITADYPNNLFTLLGGSYRIRATEPMTRLCPEGLKEDAAVVEALPVRASALAMDLSVIYLHLLLPRDLTASLPSISTRWADFLGEPQTHSVHRPGRTVWAGSVTRRVERFHEFVDSIDGKGGAALYFLHEGLPHHPWVLYPSGTPYSSDLYSVERWDSDEAITHHYYQRHLLQVGFADRLLGETLARLRDTGLFDRSLIVVTADHGISFRPNDESRQITRSNYFDILAVPLLIKAPYQQEGAVSEDLVETVDILPTIADLLGIDLPFDTDGRSALARPRGVSLATRAFPSSSGTTEISLPFHHEAAQAALKRKLVLFGSGTARGTPFGIGRGKEWIGRRPAELLGQRLDGIRVELDRPPIDADGSQTHKLAPGLVSGRLRSEDPIPGPLRLGFSVADRIQAVTTTFRPHGNTAEFIAILPEKSLPASSEDLDIIILRTRDAPSTPLPVAAFLELAPDGREQIRMPAAHLIPVVPDALKGSLDAAELKRGNLEVRGWAVDLKPVGVPEAIYGFANGRLLYQGQTQLYREDIARAFGDDDAGWSGFRHTFPADALELTSDLDLRFFAVSKTSVATELNYFRGYTWKPHPHHSKQNLSVRRQTPG